MAVICLKARLEFGGGSASIGDSIGGGGWRNDCCFCFSSTSSNVGEMKFFAFFTVVLFGAITFSFLFCTTVVNDSSTVNDLG